MAQSSLALGCGSGAGGRGGNLHLLLPSRTRGLRSCPSVTGTGEKGTSLYT